MPRFSKLDPYRANLIPELHQHLASRAADPALTKALQSWPSAAIDLTEAQAQRALDGIEALAKQARAFAREAPGDGAREQMESRLEGWLNLAALLRAR